MLKKDLEYSLYFDVFTDTLSMTPGNTQGVILTGTAEGTTLSVRLEDFETREKISERSYEIEAGLRGTAHRVADDVVNILTGETGIAATKIAFSYKTKSGK